MRNISQRNFSQTRNPHDTHEITEVKFFNLSVSQFFSNIVIKLFCFMGTEDVKRVMQLIRDAQTVGRSKDEITATFQAAGIIDKKGNLKNPYQHIYIPSEE